MRQIEIEVLSDRETVKLTSKSGMELVLDTAELDELIRNLAVARTHLNEIVTPELDSGSRVGAVPLTGWLAQPNPRPVRGGTLVLRHPGFGWGGYAVTAEQAKFLIHGLSEF